MHHNSFEIHDPKVTGSNPDQGAFSDSYICIHTLHYQPWINLCIFLLALYSPFIPFSPPLSLSFSSPFIPFLLLSFPFLLRHSLFHLFLCILFIFFLTVNSSYFFFSFCQIILIVRYHPFYSVYMSLVFSPPYFSFVPQFLPLKFRCFLLSTSSSLYSSFPLSLPPYVFPCSSYFLIFFSTFFLSFCVPLFPLISPLIFPVIISLSSLFPHFFLPCEHTSPYSLGELSVI